VIYLRDGGIVGEHRMADYENDDLKKRRQSLQEFLDEMGW
jgi:putative ABC transport system ATP-binding protein